MFIDRELFIRKLYVCRPNTINYYIPKSVFSFLYMKALQSHLLRTDYQYAAHNLDAILQVVENAIGTTNFKALLMI